MTSSWDAAARRNRLVLTASVLVLVTVALGLGLIGADPAGLAGILGLALGGALVLLDTWVSLRRPAARQVACGTALPQSRLVGTVALLVAGGLALPLLSLSLDGGLLAAASDNRGGAWLLLGAGIAPLLLAGALALLVRPDRVLLTPHEVVVRRLGCTRAVGWEELLAVSADGGPGDDLRLHTTDGRTIVTATRFLGVDAATLRTALVACRNDPDMRATLATPDGPSVVSPRGGDERRGAPPGRRDGRGSR